MPLFSIITINYNDKKGLDRTINSVLRQTFRDFEFIVIDGGSSDGSKEVLSEYTEFLTYSCSEKDNGIYDAQNKGWRKSKGRYCLFLNSGDYLANDNVLKRFADTLPVADIVYGDLLVDNGRDALYRLAQPEKFTFDDLVYSTVFHPASFISRDLLELRGGYDLSFRICADYDFFLDALLVKCCSTQYVAEAVAVFNTAGIGSSSAHRQVHEEERHKALLKYFPEEEIKAARKRVKSRKPLSVRLRNSVLGVPILDPLADYALRVYSRFRNP
jgi:glycosyltransferase involved in cell wall biosynthesis